MSRIKYLEYKFHININLIFKSMQIEFNMRSRHRYILSLMLMLAVLCVSCKDDNSEQDSYSPAYDPSKPVLVSDFTPDEGGAYQKLVIYGDNFGNDPSLVNVTI